MKLFAIRILCNYWVIVIFRETEYYCYDLSELKIIPPPGTIYNIPVVFYEDWHFERSTRRLSIIIIIIAGTYYHDGTMHTAPRVKHPSNDGYCMTHQHHMVCRSRGARLVYRSRCQKHTHWTPLCSTNRHFSLFWGRKKAYVPDTVS